jgi:hypothetical protein
VTVTTRPERTSARCRLRLSRNSRTPTSTGHLRSHNVHSYNSHSLQVLQVGGRVRRPAAGISRWSPTSCSNRARLGATATELSMAVSARTELEPDASGQTACSSAGTRSRRSLRLTPAVGPGSHLGSGDSTRGRRVLRMGPRGPCPRPG